MPTGVGGMMKTLMDEYAEIAVEAKRENAELRERAEKAERQAFNLANGFSPLTPCLECPAFAGCEKMEARMMRGYDESKHKPCHEHRLEWALGGKPQP